MEVVAGASAIVTLAATAAKLSKSVIEVSHKLSESGAQIRWLGVEIEVLGSVLQQLHSISTLPSTESQNNIDAVTSTVIDECDALLTQIDDFRKSIWASFNAQRNFSFRGRFKFVLNSSDLDYVRARLESMKTNLLLLMTARLAHQAQR